MSDNPTALTLADTATRAWRAAAAMQSVAVPEHGEFYALAAELVGTLRALGQMVDTLHGQVAGYGEGRALRDDEGGMTPDTRLAVAASHLFRALVDIGHAVDEANGFWSEIGHIGVEPGEGT